MHMRRSDCTASLSLSEMPEIMIFRPKKYVGFRFPDPTKLLDA